MNKLFTAIASLLFFTSAQGVLQAQEKDYEERVGIIVQALNEKNAPLLLNMMEDSCLIGNIPANGNNRNILPAILKTYTRIQDYHIRGTETADNAQKVQLDVTYQDGKAGNPYFVFNPGGKITVLGIIKVTTPPDPDKELESAIRNNPVPEVMQTGFLMSAGLIYMRGQLNGVDGYFLFDSGCPVILLNEKYVPPGRTRPAAGLDYHGVSTAMHQTKWATGNKLQWGSMALDSLNAPAYYMDDLSETVKLLGLIGYGAFKEYQLTLDYARQTLLLERVTPNGKLPGGTEQDKGELLGTAPVTMQRHIPIVNIQIGDKTYPMGIDTGANANLLMSEIKEDIRPFFDADEESEGVAIEGMGGNTQAEQTGFLQHARIGTLEFQDMFSVFSQGTIGAGSGEDALQIKGILGTSFLNQFRTTLNFRKGEIRFYKR